MDPEEKDTEAEPALRWQDRLKYWITIAGVIAVLVLLGAMWGYSFVMTTECDFLRFVTFQCERIFR
jgi:hypothetical protein